MNEDIINKFNELISKYIIKDKINHAYLIETNYNNRLLLGDLLINKILSFENNVTINDLKINGDLIVISNDSNTIKVEDIEQLKEKFKTKSIINSKRIYVIDGAEKLNDYSANKLLKFLEEPDDDIIAILLTSNKNSVINTIISRCYNIRFIVNDDIINEFSDEYWDSVFDFVFNIEENKEKAIAFQNRYNIKELSDRIYLKNFLNNLLLIYGDVLNYKVLKCVEFFDDNIDKIKEICNYNDVETIRNKINAINECLNRLKFNPNIKLLIDKLIILMSGVDVNV